MLGLLFPQLFHEDTVDMLWLDAFLPVSASANVILLFHKELESISKIARTEIIVRYSNIDIIQVDDTVPPSLSGEKKSRVRSG